MYNSSNFNVSIKRYDEDTLIDVFRKDFVLFFSSVQVPVRRCCVYTAVDMFTIKQTLLCFGAAGSLDMQIVIDTLTP